MGKFLNPKLDLDRPHVKSIRKPKHSQKRRQVRVLCIAILEVTSASDELLRLDKHLKNHIDYHLFY